jgi:hypothetical protein
MVVTTPFVSEANKLKLKQIIKEKIVRILNIIYILD